MCWTSPPQRPKLAPGGARGPGAMEPEIELPTKPPTAPPCTTSASAAVATTSDMVQPSRAWTQLEEVQLDEGCAKHADPALPGFSCLQKLVFFSTYLLYICVNTVNGPLMPAMKVSLNFTSHEGATIAAVQTVGIAAGKLVYGGWPVDGCGARRTYMFSMLAVGALAAAYSLQSSSTGVAAIASPPRG